MGVATDAANIKRANENETRRGKQNCSVMDLAQFSW